MNTPEKISSHVLFYMIFYLVFANLGFALGFTLKWWYLPVSYLIYTLGLFLLKLIRKQEIGLKNILVVLLLPLAFVILANYFGHTFDTSYDGQDYHQSAVISLANGWNPWKTSVLPMKIPDAEPFVIGYPKSLWIIQASIYKMFPNHINSATVMNLIVALIALFFTYGLLRRLKLNRAWAALITILIILQPTFLRQLFSFTEDGFSYQILLIAISSLFLFIMDEKKEWPLIVFLSTSILLAGTKFSNLAVFGMLGLVALSYLIYLSIKQKNFKLLYAIPGFIVIAAAVLYVPFIYNLKNYSSPVYPANLAWATNDLITQNVPLNLVDKNSLVRLFYGIYSEPQPASSVNPSDPSNIAQLKIPFSIEDGEIAASGYESRVDNLGPLFSGIFSLSLIIYLLLFFFKKTSDDKKVLLIASISLLLIIVCALLNPVANKLRYAPEVYLLPMVILIALTLFTTDKKFWMKMASFCILILISINMFMVLNSVINTTNSQFNSMSNQFEKMRNSGLTYQVQAKDFYSNYILLQENGVKFTITQNLLCNNQQVLAESNDTTFYCPQ